MPRLALRLTRYHDRGCFLPTPAIQDQIRAPASRRFPCSVRRWLAPPTPCRESPVFHDTLPAGVSPRAFRGRHFLLRPRACEPTSGHPCRAPHPGSRLPRGEPGCLSALADDTRGESRDRFRRRSVKIDDFPDPGHLLPWSTLLGCSTGRMTLPSPPCLSPFRSPRRRIAGDETSGHDGRGCPLARRFARSGRRSTTSAIRIRRAGTPRTARSPLSGMPSGTPVGARLQ